MKTKRKSSGVLGSVIASICIIVYVFALAYAIVKIYLSIEECRVTAEQEFSKIAVTALNAGTQGFMTEQFKDVMNRTLASNKSIEALIISGPDGEHVFERQQGYAITWANNSPRFRNKLSFSKENYYRPLPIQDLRNVTIRAVAGAFDFDEISQILKETLLVILAGFAVAFFTMLLQLLTGGKTNETSFASEPVIVKHIVPEPVIVKQSVLEPAAVRPPPEPVIYRKPAAEPVRQSVPEQFAVKEEAPKYSQEQFAVKEEASRDNREQFAVKQPAVHQAVQFDQSQFNIIDEPEAQSYKIEDEISSDKTVPYETAPKGLYSPRSNLGWEEYTKDRLDAEIHRCSSTEKDLTLLLMEFMDITNDLMYKLAAEETITFFSSRDLLFEYGKHGIMVILPGIDLDTGISKSEKFYQRIQEKFPNRKSSRPSLCIGLSSRSGRLINADRLMLEVKEALSKAKADNKSSIIAFKSDPEKYRAFIASQN